MGKVDNIADALTKEMPEPQVNVVAMEQENAANTADAQEKTAGLVDREGQPYDPARHETGGDGGPILNKDGTIRMKRGMGTPRSRLAEPRPQVSRAADGTPLSAPATTPTDTGRQIAESIFALGQLIGGDEWAPIINEKYGIDERAQMQSAWVVYCEAKGMSDLPPGIVVAITMIGYAVPRFAMPKTKSRWQRAKQWTVNLYFKWSNRGAAQSDRRGNGERKNDTGDKSGAKVSGKGD
ncbi:hypothetical protein LCGC14_0838100 [marine sediment metagenome]|uniref:Uncharacterized protein n=1 Tax=marine sediment metagenome TaxID=412755 RepID=A0A0F9PZ75_9ZZZZ